MSFIVLKTVMYTTAFACFYGRAKSTFSEEALQLSSKRLPPPAKQYVSLCDILSTVTDCRSHCSVLRFRHEVQGIGVFARAFALFKILMFLFVDAHLGTT